MAASQFEHWTLVDHIRFLLRSWPLLLAGALLAGGAAYVCAPQSSSRAEGVVRIGVIHGFGLIESATDLEARGSSPAFLASIIQSQPERFKAGDKVYSLRVSAPKTSGLVLITAGAPDVEGAVDLVHAVAERFESEHGPKMDAFARMTAARLVELDAETEQMRALLVKPSAGASDFPWHATLLERVAQLERERAELRLRADPRISTRTALAEEPVRFVTYIASRLGALGAILGLGLMTFFVYLAALLKARPGPSPAAVTAQAAGECLSAESGAADDRAASENLRPGAYPQHGA